MNEKIVNCDFVFKCTQQWEKMANTETDGVRFCGECQKNVYFADSYGKLDRFSREGKCVAVWQEIPVYNNLQNEFRSQMTAGMPARTTDFGREPIINETPTKPIDILLPIIGGLFAAV